MQRSLICTAVVLALLIAAGCREDTPKTTTQPTTAPAETIKVYKIEGMTCDHCVQAITDRLQKMEGVQQVRVSLENHAGWVHLDPQQAPSDQVIVESIESLGFQAKPLTLAELTTQTAPAPE